MANERAHEWAMEIRKEGNQSLQRAVLFASILIFVHLLDLRPSQVEALEIKISLPQPSILRGALAIIFYSKFYEACGNLYTANAYSKLHQERWFSRYIINTSRKRGRSPKIVKRIARIKANGGLLFMLPYALGVIFVFLFAFVIGLKDIWDLSQYAWGNGVRAGVEGFIGV